ncbi:MAG TPA: glycosyltransferase [Gemmataceae bacterium]|nr:glycosyltransferase [Gemmataceae bacterium]
MSITATLPARTHRLARRRSAPVRRPIRVCYLIDQLRPAGTETQLVALIRRLDRTRVVPYLGLLRGEGAISRSLEPDCCPILHLGVHSLCRPSTLVKARRLAQFLRRERIDVLQVYFQDSTYFGALVARLAGVPYLVRTRNNLGYWLTPLHRQLGRFCNRLTAATITNCEACRDAVIADEGAPAESVFVLENGVDFDRFSALPALAARPGPIHVGVVANLRPVKGLDVFVRAAATVAAHCPDVTFAVAGEGESRADLERLADELGLGKRLQLPGVVRDVPAFLSRADVAVLCSHSEGMSNALLEYMAAGRAIVATRVGAAERLIEAGTHGLLVPPGDATALAGAIERLAADAGLRVRLGAAARQRAEQHYSREAMVRRFENFYEFLVRGGKPCAGC